MVWKLTLDLTCDVCGNELEMKYPPEAIDHHPADMEDVFPALLAEAENDLKEKKWTRPVGHVDKWGNPITLRCAECTQARRWK